MKLAILDAATYGDTDLAPLNQGFGTIERYEMTPPHKTLKHIDDAHVIVVNKVVLNQETLCKVQNLKLICIAATGTNNVDLDAASKQGIAVVNVPGYSTPSVVSHTFALYFHLAHHNLYHHEYGLNSWSSSPIFTHLNKPFNELQDKHWGIVGMGAIGRGVAHAAAAFGCKVAYHSTSQKNLNQPYPQLSLERLLKISDIVSVHAPLNKSTLNLIHGPKLKTMKPTAILLNMGRGGIVNEADLAEALNGRQILGAGLDVLEREPPTSDNPLFQLKDKTRLLITPHIGGLSSEARRRLVTETGLNIAAHFRGERRNRV